MESNREGMEAIQESHQQTRSQSPPHQSHDHSSTTNAHRSSELPRSHSSLGQEHSHEHAHNSHERHGSYVHKHRSESENAWPDPRKYNERSLFLFQLSNPLRRRAIAGIEWKWWDRIVLSWIFLNTIQLAMFNPFDIPALKPDSPQRAAMDAIGTTFSALFLAECVAKIVALGFVMGKHTYLSEPWNWLDFVVVIIGVIDFFPSDGSSNLSALRAMRVLRPLRLVTKFPELRDVVTVLIKCIPGLSNVVFLVVFLLFIFGIVGVQIMPGWLRGQCYSIETGESRSTDNPCGFIQCPTSYECMQLNQNPGRGVYAFDNIGSSVLTVFVVMTYEGAYSIIEATQHAVGPYTWIFWFSAILFGPIFSFQLFLVVISNTYTKIMIERKQEASHAELVLHKAIFSLRETEEHPERDQADQRLDVSGKAFGAEISTRQINNSKGNEDTNSRSNKVAPESEEPTASASSDQHFPRVESSASNHSANTRKKSLRLHPKKIAFSTRIRRQMLDIAMGEPIQDFVLGVIILNTLFMMCDSNVNFCATDSSIFNVFHFDTDEILFDLADQKDNFPVNSAAVTYKAVMEGSNLFFTAIFVGELIFKIVAMGPNKFVWTGVTWHKGFRVWTAELQDMKTWRFWNIFDFVVVSVSVVEFQTVYKRVKCLSTAVTCLAAESCPDSGMFAILRILRLIRLRKLGPKFPNAFKQLKAIVSALVSIGSLLVLVVLCIFIFTILGMNLFGGTLTMEFDAGALGRGADVYVDLPVDPWADERARTASSMPGRRGVIIDVDQETYPYMPWKVEVWASEGLRKELALVPCRDGDVSAAGVTGWGVQSCVWASENPDGRLLPNGSRSSHAVITGIVPRSNYDGLFYALVTTFQVLTLENWNDNLADMTCTGSCAVDKGSNENMGSSVFLLAIIIIGNWTLLTLMLAIIINKFAEQRTQAIDAQLKAMKAHFVATYASLSKEELGTQCKTMFNTADADGSGVIEKRELQNLMVKQVNLDLPEREFNRLFKKYDTDGSGEIDFQEFLLMFDDLIEGSKKEVQGGDKIDVKKPAEEQEHEKVEEDAMNAGDRETLAERSLYLFAPSHPLRAACNVLISHLFFERFILLCIGFSAITLALDAPLLPESHPIYQFLTVCNYFLNGIFIIEALCRMVAVTFATYISSSWSRLDFLIVCTSILDMILSNVLAGGGGLAPLKTLRILRALRPLRLISKAQGLRVLITAIFGSIEPIVATCCIALGAWAVLGLMGMQFLAGTIGTCSDNKVKFMRDCWGSNDDGEQRLWLQNQANFDFLPVATITVIRIATLDNWPGMLWAATDGVGRVQQELGSKYFNSSTQEKYGHNYEFMSNYQLNTPGVFIYYLIVIIISTYIVMNMFVSVFVDSYLNATAQMKETSQKSMTLKIKYIVDDPEGGLRGKIHSTMSNTMFESCSSIIIISNITLMAFESYKQASWQTELSYVTNIFFTIVFGWDCVFKLYAYGGAVYFSNGWNKFDFFIVIISYGGMILDNLEGGAPVNPTMLRILRIFRIFRILRAFKALTSLRGLCNIVFSLARSLRSLVNLGMMLMLVFFIFAALSTTLFGTICVQGEDSLPGMGAVRCALAGDATLSIYGNFRHMGESLGTLFRIGITGDAWADILEVIGKSPPDLKRPVSSRDWHEFVDQLGYDPKELPERDLRYNAKLLNNTDKSTIRMEMAKIAIRRWNASAFGMDKDADWPTPASVPAAGAWLKIARNALPGCLTDAMIEELAHEELVDCSQVSQDPTVYDPPLPNKAVVCQSTCALGNDLSFLIASVFFVIFIIVSSFVVLQLVIAVLMDQLEATEDAADHGHKVPDCEELVVPIFNRVYQRFHYNARRRALLKVRKFHRQHVQTLENQEEIVSKEHIEDHVVSPLSITPVSDAP